MSMQLIIQYLLVLCFLVGTSSGFAKQSVARLRMHFDEAIAGNSRLSSASLPAERYLASNRFRVREGAMPRFEKRWADRKSRLAVLPGFRFFSLLKRVPAFGVEYNDDGYGNYISFTYWEKKADFDAWRTGEAFKEAHGGGGITDFVKLLGTALFILKGSPKPAFYDALLVQSGEKLSFATDNGWRSVKADGERFIEPDIFIMQEKYKISPGQEVAFEHAWREQGKLNEAPGFVGFSLLRRDADKADDGFNYIASAIWKDRRSFETSNGINLFSSDIAKPFSSDSSRRAFYEGKLTLSSAEGS